MPSAADVATCTRCGADIIWTITAAGARMPVNPEPDPKGNTAVRTDVTGTHRSRPLHGTPNRDRAQIEGGEWLAMPHAATCTSPPSRRTRRAQTLRRRIPSSRWRR